MFLRMGWRCLVPHTSAAVAEASPGKGSSAAAKKKDVDKAAFPSPRTGSMIFVYKERLFVVGGADAMDCYSMDLTPQSSSTVSSSWTAVPMTGKIPPPRRHFAWTFAAESAFLTGGALFGCALLDDLYELKLATMQWTALPTKIPYPRRHSHAIAKVGQKLYVFGGCGTNDTALDDFLVYSPVVKGWLVIKPSLQDDDRAPSKRYKHSMTSHGSSLFLFGGICGDVVLHDLWSINLSSDTSAKQGDPTTSIVAWQRIDIGTLPRSIGSSLVVMRTTTAEDSMERLLLIFCGGWSPETAAPTERTVSAVHVTTLMGGGNHNKRAVVPPPALLACSPSSGEFNAELTSSNFTKYFSRVLEDIKPPRVAPDARAIAAPVKCTEINGPVARIDSSWAIVNGSRTTLFCFGGSMGPFSQRNDVWSCTVEQSEEE